MRYCWSSSIKIIKYTYARHFKTKIPNILHKLIMKYTVKKKYQTVILFAMLNLCDKDVNYK